MQMALRAGPHKKDIISILFESFLGDCYAEMCTKNCAMRNAVRFSIKQSNIHTESPCGNLMWLHMFFAENGCSAIVILQNLLLNLCLEKISDNKKYFYMRFHTCSYGSLLFLHSRFFYDKDMKRPFGEKGTKYEKHIPNAEQIKI